MEDATRRSGVSTAHYYDGGYGYAILHAITRDVLNNGPVRVITKPDPEFADIAKQCLPPRMDKTYHWRGKE